MDDFGLEIPEHRRQETGRARVPPGTQAERADVDAGAAEGIGVAVAFGGHQTDDRHLHVHISGDTRQIDQQVFGASAAQIMNDVTDLHRV
jgi:hypothetical protein